MAVNDASPYFSSDAGWNQKEMGKGKNQSNFKEGGLTGELIMGFINKFRNIKYVVKNYLNMILYFQGNTVSVSKLKRTERF